jgi:SAM-dependent methyltransferase
LSIVQQDRIWSHFQNRRIESFDDARGRYKAMAREAVRRVGAPGRALNIGIGAGGVETRLLAAGWKVASLDPEAVARMQAQGSDARQGYAQAMPFADRSFDVVIASEVLEHIDTAVRPAVYREIERVLDAGGWFIGSVPYRERLVDAEAVCPQCGHVFHRWGHVSSFDEAALSGELSTVFSVQSCRKLAFVDLQARSSLAWYIKEAGRWILGRISDGMVYQSMVFAARKRS